MGKQLFIMSFCVYPLIGDDIAKKSKNLGVGKKDIKGETTIKEVVYRGRHSVLQGPNTPSPWKIDPLPNRETPLPPDCNILNPTPPEFRHFKLVEIPITKVLFLIKTWLTHSFTHSLLHPLTYSPSHPLTHAHTHSLTHSLKLPNRSGSSLEAVEPHP